jgi:hypothetical protein
MPKSCLFILTKVMHLIQQFSPRPVSRLEVINELLQIIEEDRKTFTIRRGSAVRYQRRLLNWQLADSVIDQAIRDRASWKGQTIWEDPPPFRLKPYYLHYCKMAKSAGLGPMSYSCFRRRASDFPSPYRFKLDERRQR